MRKKNQKLKEIKKYDDLLCRYRLLSDLMDHTPDVIYFKDRKGRLLMVNNAHAKGLRLKPKDVEGKTDFDFFPRERAEAMAKDDAYVIKTGKPIIDKVERATRADGVDNYVSTTKIPRYDDKGRISGLIGITRDITHRKQLDSLKEENLRIEKKLEALEELNRLRSEFISIVSHELRTPLAIVKEAVMLIFEEIAGPVNTKQKGLLIKAKDHIERLRRMIEELLDLSRIEKGILKLHYSLVNINNLLLDSSEFFKKMAEAKGVSLKYILPKEQINIFVDAERIYQVIANLINNAIRYTEQNGDVKVAVKILEDIVRVGVVDTGIGIANKNIPKLFNKFVQVSGMYSADRKGLGLGLSIAKDLVGKHGGEIWLESKLGVGSKFYFTLPGFYTSEMLDEHTRNKINSLLVKGMTLYLIDISIIKYEEFKEKIRSRSNKLLDDLKNIINEAFGEIVGENASRPEVLFHDSKNGILSIIYPEAEEKEANRLCELIKDKIEGYFTIEKIGDIFVNIGIAHYPDKGVGSSTKHLFANLYIKKIYIGPEVRRYKRINYNVDIELAGPKERSEKSQSIDISEGGICFVSKKSLKKDERIFLILKLPNKKNIKLKGRIAWVKRTGGKYKIGIEFTGLKQKEKTNLSRLIKSISAAPSPALRASSPRRGRGRVFWNS